MVAQPTPTMEQQRPFLLALLVGEEHIVQPKSGIHAGKFCRVLLLPVEPKEIDPLTLEGMNHIFQVIVREFPVGNVEGHILLVCGIDSHRARHCRIAIFPGLNAGCRMNIERGLQPLFVHTRKKTCRIGE